MLLRRFAAVSAVLVTSAGLVPAVTHADTPPASTLYVSNAVGSGCSDSAGLGTQDEPFCTLQAAVNVVNPGQTVSMAPGSFAPTTITRSGTAAAPITISGYWPANARTNQAPFSSIGSGGTAIWTGTALTISGASYINVTHVELYPGSNGALTVSHGSNVTVNRTTLQGDNADTSAPMVDITDASSAVAFERSFIYTAVTAIRVEGGSTGTVISADNALTNGPAPIISVTDAPNTEIVGNTLPPDCATAVTLSQGSQNAVIENNIIVQPVANCQNTPALISADATAAPTATDDYNDVMDAANAAPGYNWAGVSYTTPGEFSAATGQGAHDVAAAKGIDAANSAAPGELSTDIYGNPRIDDSQVADSGAGPATYYDRGAVELQEPVGISAYYPSTGQAPTGGTVTFTATASDAWTGNLTYTFNFGDGTTKTTNTGTATHVYSTTGSFTTSVSVTGTDGVPAVRTSPITIVPPAPLVAAMALTSAETMTAVATQQSTDSWAITGYSVDFGDGTTPMQAVEGTPGLSHNYTKLGTYNVTLTTTDADGQTVSTSQKFTTAGSDYTAYGPVRVLDTRHGTGTGGVVAKVGPNQTLKLKIAGSGAIPANVSAVAFNLTVTGPSAGGYLVAYPDLQDKPATSSLNFTPGQTKATNVMVAVGADGYVDLYNGSSGTVDLVADVNGYFTQAQAARYTPVHPTRILDTRHGTGTGGVVAALGAGKTLTLPVTAASQVGLPDDTIAVALNLTAVDEVGGGYVTAYQDGKTRPVTSSLNFDAGQVVPNTVIVPVGSDGKIAFYNGSGGTIDLVADVEGYFDAAGRDAYLPITPRRLYDSRTQGGPFTSCCNTGVNLPPLGEQPVTPFALSYIAYVFNVTVTQTVGSGYVTVYPDDLAKPATSNVNFSAGQTTANTAIAQASMFGAADEFAVNFTQPQSSTQLIVDLFGYFSAT